MARFNRTLIAAALVFLFSLHIALAQNDSVTQLGGYLDQQAAANGLPTGDGSISPVEQSVASALIDEITGFSQSVTDFQQASPANKTWLDGIEQRMETYNQQIADAGANAPVDVRASIISNAVAQYGQDVDDLQAQNTYDVRAQIISDAVAQYGNDARALQTEAPDDPRAAAISQAVAQYGNQLPTAIPDPRASAISQAVAQYGQEVGSKSGQAPSHAVSQAINTSLREGTRDYINRSSIPRKLIVIRHIDQMIASDFDKNSDEQLELLPGFWRHTRSTVTMSGACQSAAMGFGSNPDGGGSDATPVIPLVPIYQSTARDFIFIDNRPHGLLQPQVYGETTTERQLVMQNGKTTGSINTSHTTEYRIVASDLIAVHQIYAEEGGCTIEYESSYELAQMDTSVVIPTIDDMATPQPAPTPLPASTPVVTEQPIPIGTYPVTWTVDSGTCTDKTQPTFTRARVDYTANGDMLLRLGDDEHTLFAIGDQQNPRYQFISSERQINIQVIAGVIKMDWGKFAGTAMCFKGGELSAATAPAATTQPSVNPTATPVAAAGGQQYQISFHPDETMCPKTVQGKLPAFDGTTFEALPDGTYQLVLGGEKFTFKDQYGYATYDGSDPSKGIAFQIAFSRTGNSGGMLGLTYMTASGEMCLAQMSLSPG